ncbi:MAG: LptF/LptG family permease [Armatimonadetes bacterium]|nr:LptF/LptG family permease [Armatimonadota bacterium]
MKRLDRLVLQELFGPWAFGVAMFTVLIMAGSFLFELTRYLSEGVPFLSVMELMALLLPGVMAKTFPMAVLLSALLAFGRLSSDSEIVAVKAAGVSLGRLMIPVAAFGIVVALATFLVTENVVPSATQVAVKKQKEFQEARNGTAAQDISHAVYDEKTGKLRASFWAADFNFLNRTLSRVQITVYDEQQMPSAYIFVNEFKYTSEKEWVMQGGGTATSADGRMTQKFESGSPEAAIVPRMDATPEELEAKLITDLDALPMGVMGKQIEKLKATPDKPGLLKDKIANLEFGYWNKVAVPLAALVFGLVGAPLGIRSHRVPASAGFWQAVIIILAYFFMANVMSILARGGRIPAFVASFLPIAIGLAVAGFLIHRRNV